MQGVSKTLGCTWINTMKEKKFISVYVHEHLVFDVQPPRSPDLSPLDFYLWGHLKTSVY
jgi:hypothetical protein